MKQLFVILPLVLVLCFAYGCELRKERAEEPAVDIAAETEALRSAFASLSKAGPTKDVSLFMAQMADDVFSSGIGDKEAIREMYASWFAEGNYWEDGAIEKIDVSASGDLAYTIGSFQRFLVGESRDRYTNLSVCKKQTDGSWKIVAF